MTIAVEKSNKSYIHDGKLFVDGKQVCYRCGMEKNSAEIKEGWKCGGWGVVHKTHLWTIKDKQNPTRS